MNKIKYEKIFYEKDDIIYEIVIGKNDYTNWYLIDNHNEDNIWFHLDNHPSSHVILNTNLSYKKIHKSVIKYCAFLCKKNSKIKEKTTIIYTKLKNVKKSKDVGSVIATNTKSIKL